MGISDDTIPNELFRYERLIKHWSQEHVVEKINGANTKLVKRWEKGKTAPSPYYCQQLEEAFGRTTRELGWAPKGKISFWHVPLPRNPYFTGREDILNQIHSLFVSQRARVKFQPIALTGLGGVGKTQIACEYAYQYMHEYHTVLWLRAEKSEGLASDFAAIATWINLDVEDEHNQTKVIVAVQEWLTHPEISRWLLIFDNIEDLEVLYDFLPMHGCRGHVLLTTRPHATGTLAHGIEIEKMRQEVGAELLLRRAKVIEPAASYTDASQTDYEHALAISHTLFDGLPLAIDQAGAYIEETKGSLRSYLDQYHKQPKDLRLRRGKFKREYPLPVSTSLALSIARVQEASLTAVDLLNLFAFLDPDAIPEELATEGFFHIGSPIASSILSPGSINTAIEKLIDFSLISHNADQKLCTIHRLVQAAIQDRMDEDTKRNWAKCATRVVNQAFPDIEHTREGLTILWQEGQRYLSHAQACAKIIEQYDMVLPEASRLLLQLGAYLEDRGLFRQSKPFYQRSLAIRENALGPEHPDVAQSLIVLANLYENEGRYEEAEPLYQRALSIREKAFGPDDILTADTLGNLGILYHTVGKLSQAETLYQRALEIREKVFGPDHPDVADSLSNFADLYDTLGQHEEAEPLYKRALEILEKAYGPDHPDVADCLNNLGAVYFHLARYEAAEVCYQRALAIDEKAYGPEHYEVATLFINLAELYNKQGKQEKAEELAKRGLAIGEKTVGPEHPDLVHDFNVLAQIYLAQGRYEEAKSLCKQALRIGEQSLEFEQDDMRAARETYTAILRATGQRSEAKAQGMQINKTAKARTI